ncbi:hypothetical protein K7W42_19170 [Deinococcus sp. HMF7604]|uniref:ribonuclease HI n=1 Tax=Deinococcus betulae TaxID=2873312 RepID=UPI001CCA7355|nr:hypothetical protein [Deinococcus betulae]MBZ9752962.1 hypothetical protein [Deinococcus betulae]
MTVVAHTDGAVVPGGAGWGVVMPGQPERRFSGMLDTGDVMVAELWAVKMALRHTPNGAGLEVHTDSQSLPGLLGRHDHEGAHWDRRDLRDLTGKILGRAQQRGITLTCLWASRNDPMQEVAHKLAVAGRVRGKGEEGWAAQLTGRTLEVWQATRRARNGWVVAPEDSLASEATVRAVLAELPETPVPLIVQGSPPAIVAALQALATELGRTLTLTT